MAPTLTTPTPATPACRDGPRRNIVSCMTQLDRFSGTPIRSRTVTWDAPGAPAPDMSGLEYLRSVFAAERPAAPIGALMGMAAESVEEGRVVFTLVPAEYHYNPIGAVHGGVACTLLDSAM